MELGLEEEEGDGGTPFDKPFEEVDESESVLRRASISMLEDDIGAIVRGAEGGVGGGERARGRGKI